MEPLISHILLADGSAGKQMCIVVISPCRQIYRAHLRMYGEIFTCWHPNKKKCSMFDCPVIKKIAICNLCLKLRVAFHCLSFFLLLVWRKFVLLLDE